MAHITKVKICTLPPGQTALQVIKEKRLAVRFDEPTCEALATYKKQEYKLQGSIYWQYILINEEK